jgi:hypothetical protein
MTPSTKRRIQFALAVLATGICVVAGNVSKELGWLAWFLAGMNAHVSLLMALAAMSRRSRG